MFQKATGVVLALAVTTLAAASDVSIATTAVVQTINVASSDIGTTDDNIANFLAVVTDVLSYSDRSDNHAGNSNSGDDRRFGDRDNRHREHLGLGFAHGMANGNPHIDECHGNGHVNPGNDLGYRDCGNPSPSD